MADIRVLVVDDEQSMRDLLATMLPQSGDEVALAERARRPSRCC
jgi:CheY-like chemotaxis protein